MKEFDIYDLLMMFSSFRVISETCGLFFGTDLKKQTHFQKSIMSVSICVKGDYVNNRQFLATKNKPKQSQLSRIAYCVLRIEI